MERVIIFHQCKINKQKMNRSMLEFFIEIKSMLGIISKKTKIRVKENEEKIVSM